MQTITGNPYSWPAGTREAMQAALTIAPPAYTPDVEVLDDSRRNDLPTGYVIVRAGEPVAALELALAAGFGSQHWGYSTQNHRDGTTTVALFND